jgi:hypothetical protein
MDFQIIQVTMKHDACIRCHVRRIHVDITSVLHSHTPSVGPSSIVWSSEWTWTSSAFSHQWECLKWNGGRLSGAVYTMDHEVVPRPSKRCDWTLKSSWDDLGLHQGKNGRVTTEVKVHKFVFLSLLYPLPWSNGFSVGTIKRGGLGKITRAHVRKCHFNVYFFIF